MDSDESYHSESEFYYPDEIDNDKNAEKSTKTDRNAVKSGENTKLMADIQNYIIAQRPESTVKKTKYDLNIWKRYLETKNESGQIENIPPEELNALLCRFFMDTKKKDGSQYEPVSLTSLQRSLQRYLNDKGSTINLFKDEGFKTSREVLSARKKELVVQNAKGNRPQAARELTAEEEDEVFRLGESSPEALQRTV